MPPKSAQELQERMAEILQEQVQRPTLNPRPQNDAAPAPVPAPMAMGEDQSPRPALREGRALARAVKRAVCCTCLTDVCDCQAYPTHVSQECPVHNRKPMPADTCPVHGTFNAALA